MYGCKFIMCGGSGGGFAALKFASLSTDSGALVWNAQTDVLKYGWSSVDAYLASAFPSEYVLRGKNVDAEEWRSVLEEYNIAPSILDFNTIARLRKVLFLQQASDWHVQAHFEPMLDAAVAREVVSGRWRAPGDLVLMKREWMGSHAPPSRAVLLSALGSLLMGSSASEAADGLDGLSW